MADMEIEWGVTYLTSDKKTTVQVGKGNMNATPFLTTIPPGSCLLGLYKTLMTWTKGLYMKLIFASL